MYPSDAALDRRHAPAVPDIDAPQLPMSGPPPFTQEARVYREENRIFLHGCDFSHLLGQRMQFWIALE